MPNRRPKHIPLRSCVVCREPSDKRTLLRVVRQPEKAGGSVVVDESGKLAGRGAYVCADVKCIGLASKQKRFERALAVNASSIESELFERLLRLVPAATERNDAPATETNEVSEVLIELS